MNILRPEDELPQILGTFAEEDNVDAAVDAQDEDEVGNEEDKDK